MQSGPEIFEYGGAMAWLGGINDFPPEGVKGPMGGSPPIPLPYLVTLLYINMSGNQGKKDTYLTWKGASWPEW